MHQYETVNCPCCGEVINRKAPACPYCGADEQTGWSEQTYLDGIDIGDESDYAEAYRNEFSSSDHSRFSILHVSIAVGLLILFIVAIFWPFF